MAAASTSTPNMSLTSLSGITGGGGTTTTNLETVGTQAPSTTGSASGLPIATGVTVGAPAVNVPTQVAVLTLSDTTLTAYAVPSTTGLAVLNGQTLTFRHEGITLSDGNVVSLGFNGLVESTTTATYAAVTDVSASSYVLPTGPGPVIFNSTFPSLEPTTTSGATLTGEQSSGMTTLTMSQSGSGSGSASPTAGTTAGGAGAGSSGGSSGGTATQASASASSSPGAAATLSAGKAAVLLGAVGGMVAWGL